MAGLIWRYLSLRLSKFPTFALWGIFIISGYLLYAFYSMDVPPIYGRADALVVLGGNYHAKVESTAQLYKNGLAPLILLSDDGVKSRWSREYQRNLFNVEWTEEELVSKGVPRSAIIKLDFKKSGTIYDAVAVRDYALQHGIENIAVVTFDFHARRAYWSFRKVFQGISEEIQFLSLSTDTGLFSGVSEVLKLGFYMMRHSLMPPAQTIVEYKG